MTRPFFALGSYRARVQIPVSADFSLAGAASHSMAASIGGTATLVPRGASIARSAFSFVGTAGITPTIVDVASLAWTVGTVTIVEGQTGQPTGQFNVAATGPSGYTAGGVYSFGYEGTTPPTGLTLDEDGNPLDVGTATPATTNGVRFSYYEPGATTTLTLHSTGAGTFPYMATIYPTEGAVPSGQILLSPDDSTFRSSVLSTWPDGSAQVIVGAGRKAVSANSTSTVKLRPGSPSGTNMTTNDLVSVVNTVAVNFGTPLSLTLTTTNHDRIWWANPETICARYRIPITNRSPMEAVIDVHCFRSGRAFVEVVIENGKINTSAPTRPSDQTYTNATVTVNGSLSLNGAGTSTSSAYWGTHEAFRAWYCSGWVGGDPGITVTHDITSMQSHPLLFRIEKAAAYNFQTYIPLDGLNLPREYWRNGNGTDISQPYSSDSYQPFAFGRQRYPEMGAGGEDQSIGPLPKWEARYLQSGDPIMARATIASALSILTYAINYRSTTTNLVPTHTSVYGQSTQVSYPDTGGQFGSGVGRGCFEVAHEPAVGLMAFLCRPSPCFIEVAQKIAHLNAVAYSAGTQLFGYYFQTRGKAWCMRNLAHAIFLTPTSVDSNVTAWRTSAASNMGANVTFLQKFDQSAEDKLAFVWDYTPDGAEGTTPYFFDHSDGDGAGIPFQFAVWEHHWLATELNKIHQAKLLTGTDQANLSSLADWALSQPVRWVNEQSNGGWRFLGYRTTCGTADSTNSVTMGQLNDWGSMRAYRNPTNPTEVSGPWVTGDSNDKVNYNITENLGTGWITYDGTNTNLVYVPIFWSALTAAVERGVSGAETAWNTVTNNVNNLSTFRDFAAINPTQMSYPRNK